MSDWRSIETAPKDGTPVDLWTNRGERITDAIWKDNFWKYWGIGGFETMEYCRIEGIATHWMELPQPPASEGKHE